MIGFGAQRLMGCGALGLVRFSGFGPQHRLSDPLGDKEVSPREKLMTMAATLRIREIQVNISDSHQVLRETRASQAESIGLNGQDQDTRE